jgi:hypothetical protein
MKDAYGKNDLVECCSRLIVETPALLNGSCEMRPVGIDCCRSG